MKEAKAPIKRIVLDVGGKEINLTLEQAKVLFESLNELFGSKTVVSPIYIERPYHWYWRFNSPNWTYTTAAPTNTASVNGMTTIKASYSNDTLRLTC